MADAYKMANVKAGERLKFVRKTILKLNDARELADRMKISQGSVISYECGKTGMSIEFLVELYNKYGILPNYLILGIQPVRNITQPDPI